MTTPRLLDQVRIVLRRKHCALRTEHAYVNWIRRYIFFHNKRHPASMGVPEIETFLTHLAVDLDVAASTQNQALSALLSLYREVLHKDVGALDAVRARKPKRLPTVLTRSETLRILNAMSGVPQLMAKLLYGSGLRALECVRLRVKDVDFEQHLILVRDGKGEKDRITMLPEQVTRPLREHLERVYQIHARDLKNGFGAVCLPHALAVQYPSASQDWTWQSIFPAKSPSADPRSDM